MKRGRLSKEALDAILNGKEVPPPANPIVTASVIAAASTNMTDISSSVGNTMINSSVSSTIPTSISSAMTNSSTPMQCVTSCPNPIFGINTTAAFFGGFLAATVIGAGLYYFCRPKPTAIIPIPQPVPQPQNDVFDDNIEMGGGFDNDDGIDADIEPNNNINQHLNFNGVDDVPHNEEQQNNDVVNPVQPRAKRARHGHAADDGAEQPVGAHVTFALNNNMGLIRDLTPRRQNTTITGTYRKTPAKRGRGSHVANIDRRITRANSKHSLNNSPSL